MSIKKMVRAGQKGSQLVALVGALGVLGLGGCVSDDPRQGGFFGGVAGLSSGNYDRRIASRRQSLDTVQQMQQELQADNAVLQQQRNAKLSEIRRTKGQISALNRKTQALKNDIARLRRSNKISASQAQKMQGEVGRIANGLSQQNQKLARAQQSNDAAELAKVKAQVAALRRQQAEQARLMLLMAQ